MGGDSKENLPYPYWILYLVLSTNVSAFTEDLNPETKLDVYILSGQSNMSGRGGVVDGKWNGFVPHQCQPHPSILRLTSDLKWVEAQEPLHKDIDTKKVCGVGPGMAFANRLFERYKKCGVKKYIGLVPCAIGGTAIKEWEKGSFLYSSMINRTKAALGYNEGHHVLRALLWYQGESDALSEGNATSYKQNLERLIHDIRSDLQEPNLPFIQVAITVDDPQWRKELVEKVREAQLGVNIPNVYCVDAKGLELNEDKLHLTTKSQVKLGKLLADTYVTHSSISHCGPNGW